jgi:hypothetical protein
MLKYLYFIAIFLLTSCGFKPLYNNNNSVKNLSLIKISEPNNILEIKLNQELSKLLSLDTSLINHRYSLYTSVNCEYLDNIILPNSDIIEQIISIKIDYSLKNTNTDVSILHKTFHVSDSLNNSVPLYTASVNANKTKSELINAAAKIIQQDLILFFLSSNETISQ